MFFDFPHRDVGFKDDEWEFIPRTDKLIIRDYFLNEGDKDSVMLFGFYDTDSQVRKAIKTYHLQTRPAPNIQFALAQFAIR